MSTPPDPYNTPGDENRSELPSFEPGAGAQRPLPNTKPEPPKSIANAVRLMFVGAGLLVVYIIVVLSTIGDVREQLAEGDQGLTGEELDAGVAAFVGLWIVFGLVALGLWIWMALANRRGLSWARIVATVLGGLNVLISLFFLIGSSGPVMVILLLMIALAPVIIFLLFRPESSQYYNAVTEYRHQHGQPE